MSPRLRLDDLYRSLFEPMATQIAPTVADARADEEEGKRAKAADVPEVIETSLDGLADRVLTASVFLEKPFLQAKLADAIATALGETGQPADPL